MSRTPAISVVLPVYNGECYLRQALASIRWQTFEDWEAICVNDGSTDRSLEILEEFAAVDKRFRIIDQDNQGIVGALNNGILAAKANWIARMDCDDVSFPERFAIQWQFLKENPDILVVGTDLLAVDIEGQPILVSKYSTKHSGIEESILSRKGSGLAHACVFMRRDAFIEAGMYRKKYEWVEDIDLWLRMAMLGKLASIPRILYFYRFHEQGVCWNQGELQRERIQALLCESHRVRGLPEPVFKEKNRKQPRQKTSAAGKWARQAARSGYFQTALKYWLLQVKAEPFSWLTARVTFEMVLRGIGAKLSGRSAPQFDLPDWRKWDATGPGTTESESRAA